MLTLTLSICAMLFTLFATLAAFLGDAVVDKNYKGRVKKVITPRGWVSLACLVVAFAASVGETALNTIEQNTPNVSFSADLNQEKLIVRHVGDQGISAPVIDYSFLSKATFCPQTDPDCGYGFYFRLPLVAVHQRVEVGAGAEIVASIDVASLSNHVKLFRSAIRQATDSYRRKAPRLSWVETIHQICINVSGVDRLGGAFRELFTLRVDANGSADVLGDAASYSECEGSSPAFDISNASYSGMHMLVHKDVNFKGIEVDIPDDGEAVLFYSEDFDWAATMGNNALRFLNQD